MGSIERLPRETASAHEPLAYERRHRYELGRAAAPSERLSVDVADPVSFLDCPLGDRFDAIVCLEGWEQRREPDGLVAALRRHAEAGLRLVYALAHRAGTGDRVRDQATTAGYDTTLAAFAGLPHVVVLPQYRVEGSVICPPDADLIDVSFVGECRPEIESASHVIVCIGFPPSAVAEGSRGRVHVDAASLHNHYVMNLEAANLELLRANATLAPDAVSAALARAAGP